MTPGVCTSVQTCTRVHSQARLQVFHQHCIGADMPWCACRPRAQWPQFCPGPNWQPCRVQTWSCPPCWQPVYCWPPTLHYAHLWWRWPHRRRRSHQWSVQVQACSCVGCRCCSSREAHETRDRASSMRRGLWCSPTARRGWPRTRRWKWRFQIGTLVWNLAWSWWAFLLAQSETTSGHAADQPCCKCLQEPLDAMMGARWDAAAVSTPLLTRVSIIMSVSPRASLTPKTTCRTSLSNGPWTESPLGSCACLRAGQMWRPSDDLCSFLLPLCFHTVGVEDTVQWLSWLSVQDGGVISNEQTSVGVGWLRGAFKRAKRPPLHAAGTSPVRRIQLSIKVNSLQVTSHPAFQSSAGIISLPSAWLLGKLMTTRCTSSLREPIAAIVSSTSWVAGVTGTGGSTRVSTRLPHRSAAKCSFHLSLSCSASSAKTAVGQLDSRKCGGAKGTQCTDQPIRAACIACSVGCLCTVGDFTPVCFTITYQTGPFLHLLPPEKIQIEAHNTRRDNCDRSNCSKQTLVDPQLEPKWMSGSYSSSNVHAVGVPTWHRTRRLSALLDCHKRGIQQRWIAPLIRPCVLCNSIHLIA